MLLTVHAAPFGPHFRCRFEYAAVAGDPDHGMAECRRRGRCIDAVNDETTATATTRKLADESDVDNKSLDGPCESALIDAAFRIVRLHADGNAATVAVALTVHEVWLLCVAASVASSATLPRLVVRPSELLREIIPRRPAAAANAAGTAGIVSPRLAAFAHLALRVSPPVTPRCDAAAFGAAFACYRHGTPHSVALVWTHVDDGNEPPHGRGVAVSPDNDGSESRPSSVELRAYARLARSVRKEAWLLRLKPRLAAAPSADGVRG